MNSISVEEFVSFFDAGMADGRKEGWLEERDHINRKEPLQRKDAARIVHEYMKRVLMEKDFDDISAAAVLRDIYDCHVCVNHVAQVYLKGIMDAKTVAKNKEEFLIFGNNDFVTKKEAGEIISRLQKKMFS